MAHDPDPLFISTMKNEGPYILEWLAYHRVIGFSKFLIYTNDCADGTTDILDRLTEMGLVQHEENVVLKRGPHKSALKYAQAHPLTAAAQWIYVADIDEYLNIHIGAGTVQELIAACPDADAIPVTWRLFSHNGHIELDSPYLLEAFTDAERPLEDGGQESRFVKTLFRKDERIERFGLHVPIVAKAHEADFVWVAPDGRRLGAADNKSRPKDRFGYGAAQVNHYAVRSLDGYIVKRDRGRANHFRHVLGSDYWRRMCRGGEEDRSIQRHAPAVKAEMERLLEDKALAGLHAASLAWHQDKVAALRQLEDFETLRNELLALSAAGDHQRREAPDAAPEAGEEAVRRLEAAAGSAGRSRGAKRGGDVESLIRALRGSLGDIEPVEAQLAAADLLNRFEAIRRSAGN